MQTLRDHLKNFDLLTEQFDFTKKRFQYRKPDPSIYNCENKKAIDSDFIVVFFLDKLGRKDSFSFKFTFLNSEKVKVIEEQYFEIVFKINNKFYNSKLFSIQEAKKTLSFINNSIKENNFDKVSFFEFLKANFLVPTKTLEDNLILFEEEFNKSSEELQDKLALYETNSLILEQIIKDKKLKLMEFKEELEETKQVKILQNRIYKLNNIINEKVVSEEERLNSRKYTDLLKLSNSNIKNYIEEIHCLIMKVNKKFNIKSSLINNLKNKFLK